jgi:hypothetical protein
MNSNISLRRSWIPLAVVQAFGLFALVAAALGL